METIYLDSYMAVEPVLRFLKKNALALPQYKIGEIENHFFKCSELKEKIDVRLYRHLASEVITHMCVSKDKTKSI